ncbi:HesA/MoeB/ThiF family protein [Salinimonas chungwhensis]|uniref:HesA/MoeB/ThiF family protein n=1 Tax=Salinimonas chungwhensis TaxID=265425 RepID=UPI0003670961|nr:HesA/MoeB/ThiF family protein [Salinimonas chungwhensis]
MTDKAWYSRYSRQLLIDGFDEQHQHLLGDANVTIIGLGGLGCSAAMHLAASGVGALNLIDADTVSLSNLPRQCLFSEDDIGKAKTAVARAHLRQHNSHCHILAFEKYIEDSHLVPVIKQTDLLLDCTDNAQARLFIASQARRYNKAVISAAANSERAHIIPFHWHAGQSCYGCLHALDATPDESCLRHGILGPVVNLAGTYQALLALHYLTHRHPLPWGTLMQFCGISLTWKHVYLPQAPNCSVCQD